MFSTKQPDLNWENPEVRQAIYAMMNRWVERGVDGFRMDVINFISKDPALPDGEVAPGHRYGNSFRSIGNGPRIHEFLQEMNAAVLTGQELITVGEMPGCNTEQARLYTDPTRHEMDMVFTFEHVNLDQAKGGHKWDLVELQLPLLKGNLAHWQTELGEVGWNSLYWNNHDQPRAVSRFGDDSAEHRVNSAKTLGSILHMLRGTPYVYQGEELGMTNATFTEIEQYRDIESVNYHRDATSLGVEASRIMDSLTAKSRDNARTPMQWDDSSKAGFTGGVPWLTVNPNYGEINAAAAVADPESVFHHYRKLIKLRHELAIVVDGSYDLLLAADEHIFAFTRTSSQQVLLTVANCSSNAVEIPDGALPDLSSATLVLGTHNEGAGDEGAGRTWRPWESRILLLDN